MRTLSTSKVNTPTTTTTTSLAPTATVPVPVSVSVPASSTTAAQHSQWHSPVPYLFGGLAAMLGLIAFALLILACSYWKLSGQLQNEDGGDRDLEKEGDSAKKEPVKVYEEKILVIMAGDEKPTFLATPVCAKCSSFADGFGKDVDKHLGNHENCDKSEKEIKDNNHHHHHYHRVEATAAQENEGTQETQQQSQ